MQKEKKLTYIIQNLILIAIIIVTSLTPSLTYFDKYTPLYEMTIIFFSCVTYPKAFSFTKLLIYGMLRDILFAHPMGFSPIMFLSLKTIVNLYQKRTENTTIWVVFFQFTLSLAIVLIFQTIILSLVFKYNFIDLLYGFIKRWYSTSLLYPLFHLCYSSLMKFIDKKYCDLANQS